MIAKQEVSNQRSAVLCAVPGLRHQTPNHSSDTMAQRQSARRDPWVVLEDQRFQRPNTIATIERMAARVQAKTFVTRLGLLGSVVL